MSNPLFNRFNNQPVYSNPLGNLLALSKQFNDFRSNFQGDPRAKVEELLRTGQMTREQFEQYSLMANQLNGLFKSK